MARSRPAKPRGASEDVQFYRAIAGDVLQQLDWCIGYLHGIGKRRVSHALARNRNHIRADLLRDDTEPLPSSD